MGLIHRIQVNAMVASRQCASEDAVARTASPSAISEHLQGGGRNTKDIYRVGLQRVTSEPNFQKLRKRRAGMVPWLRRNMGDRNRKTKQLHEAIRNGRAHAVLELREEGQTPNTVLPADNMPPLHRAIRLGPNDTAYKIVAALAYFGATIGARDGKGETAPSLALRRRRPLRWIMMLCEMDDEQEMGGADRATFLRDGSGNTVLHLAITNELSVGYTIILLTHGARVEMRSDDESRLLPLSDAAQAGSDANVQALLQFNAQICCDLGLCPLERASIQGHRKVIDVLCHFDASWLNDTENEPPLTLAEP